MKIVSVGNGRGIEVDGMDEPLPISFAFGSGKTGVTYVAVQESGSTVELHKSYFPSLRRWYVTPGHESQNPNHVGIRYTGTNATRCFGCHTIAPVPADLKIEPQFYGVGCESCHGPAGRHVEMMVADRQGDVGIERLGSATTARYLEVCGRCHRTSSMVTTANQKSMTQRFQPYGLVLSRCYTQSSGGLSCSTCHNPHANAETRPQPYIDSCLKCHGNNVVSSVDHGRKCPLSPSGNCIPCHMPLRKVFVAGNVPTAMPDHRIAVYRIAKTGAAATTPESH